MLPALHLLSDVGLPCVDSWQASKQTLLQDVACAAQALLWPLWHQWPTQLSGSAAVLQVVAGAGPSGIAVAERVAKAGYRVCVVDPAPRAHWPNNYGVWVDEFDAMGLGDCLEIVWPQAKVHLDSRKEDER